jgi:hypothetical protein
MGERRRNKIEEILISWRASELKPRNDRRSSPRRVNV